MSEETLDAALAGIKAEFDALDVGALAARLEAELDAVLADLLHPDPTLDAVLAELLHPKTCPWCGRPFDDSPAEVATKRG